LQISDLRSSAEGAARFAKTPRSRAWRRSFAGVAAALWALGASFGGLGGCAGDGSSSSSRDFASEAEGVFSAPGGGQGASAERAWSIVLATFDGASARSDAERALSFVRSEGGFPGAFIERREGGAAILTGRYEGPDDPDARRDLASVRSQPAFARAFLARRQIGAPLGGMPNLNLLRAKEGYGDRAQYTLQVAVYESDDRSERMRAAEQAAAALRREGETAFYYHGATRSMVTVGVFSDEDFDPSTGVESAALRDARRRHPYNLLNGRGIRERGPDGREALQRSALVQIPEGRGGG
jgi:hypothetical protein